MNDIDPPSYIGAVVACGGYPLWAEDPEGEMVKCCDCGADIFASTASLEMRDKGAMLCCFRCSGMLDGDIPTAMTKEQRAILHERGLTDEEIDETMRIMDKLLNRTKKAEQ